MKKILNKKITILILLFIIMIILFISSLFVGSSNISFNESLKALFGKGQNNHIIIMQNIRLPRAIAAIVVGCGLAVAGLIMQTTLGNEMASPSTLGVSNAATLGANISIIVLAGGFLNTGNNVQNFFNGNNVFSTSLIAFIFAFISVLITLGLCKIKSFSKETVILCGVAMAAIWTALTSLIHPSGWYTYGSTGSDHLDSVLQDADEDPTNPNNMIFLYTRNSVAKCHSISASGPWNREHVWPQSLSNGCW